LIVIDLKQKHMNTYRFKTNLKCSGCVKVVSPLLDSILEIENWEINLESDNKTLEVESKSDVSDLVIETIKKAGYQISRLD